MNNLGTVKRVTAVGTEWDEWNPTENLGDSMELLTKISSIEYMKWNLSSSYYHGMGVSITPPCKEQNGYRKGMRDAYSWAVDERSLPEHITRAVLNALGEDVEINDVYKIAESSNKKDPAEKSAYRFKCDVEDDTKLLEWLQERHPNIERRDLPPDCKNKQFIVESRSPADPEDNLITRLGTQCEPNKDWTMVYLSEQTNLPQANATQLYLQVVENTKAARFAVANPTTPNARMTTQYRVREVGEDNPNPETMAIGKATREKEMAREKEQ